MNIEDEPNNEDTPAPDAPAVETPTPDAPDAKPETGVAAFDKGLADLPEAEGGVKPAEAAKPVSGATGAAVAEADAGTAIAGKDDSPENDEKIIKKALVEAELKKFNDELRAQGSKPLSKAAADRFRELSMRPTADDVKKLVTDAEAKFAPREELAQHAERMQEVITDCQANPQQIGNVFRYLKDINSGDPVAMRRAFTSMKQELTWLGEQIGEAVDSNDPLAAYPDLKKMVEEGDLKLGVALETAQLRATKRLQEQQSTRQETATAAQREYAGAIQQRDQQLAELDAHWKKTDPQYLDKLPHLKQTFAVLKQKNDDGTFVVHPSRWAAAIRSAYAEVVLPAKPAATPTPSPMRTTGITAPVMQIPKNPLQAFDLGLKSLEA